MVSRSASSSIAHLSRFLWRQTTCALNCERWAYLSTLGTGTTSSRAQIPHHSNRSCARASQRSTLIPYWPPNESLSCPAYSSLTMKRRRGGIDSNAFDVLVEHDVRAYLLVQALRGKQRTDGRYGYTTWWLTLDHTGFRVQQAAKAKHITFATPVGSCMSPDFLLRYLSIRPRTQGEEDYLDSVLPLSVEL